MPNFLQSGQLVKATATHESSAVATISGISAKKIYITGISGSSDTSGALILVKDGTTVIWQDIVNDGNYTMVFLSPLTVTAGAKASVTVDGTAACTSNITGVQL